MSSYRFVEASVAPQNDVTDFIDAYYWRKFLDDL